MASNKHDKTRPKEFEKGSTDPKEKLLAEGLEFMQKNQLDAASKCFDKAIQVDPNYMLASDLEMACSGLQRDPQDEASLDLWATMLSKLGRIEDALKVYEEITKTHPGSKQAWKNLAFFHEYVMKKRVKEGFNDMLIINPLEIALELDPSDVRIMSGLAILYGENKDYTKSLSYLERITAIKSLTPVQQRFMEETKKKIVKGFSRPFIDPIKSAALPVPGGENICPNCGEKVSLNSQFCNKCGQRMF